MIESLFYLEKIYRSVTPLTTIHTYDTYVKVVTAYTMIEGICTEYSVCMYFEANCVLKRLKLSFSYSYIFHTEYGPN